MQPKPNSISHDSLAAITDIDLGALSEISDERDIYLSVHIKTASTAELDANRSFIDSRFRAMERSLSPDLRDAFRSTSSMFEEAIASTSRKGERSRVIFASGPASFLHVYRLNLEMQPMVVLDSSPFLLPLARQRDDYEDYALLLLDSQRAQLFTIRSRIIQDMGSSSIDLMNKRYFPCRPKRR